MFSIISIIEYITINIPIVMIIVPSFNTIYNPHINIAIAIINVYIHMFDFIDFNFNAELALTTALYIIHIPIIIRNIVPIVELYIIAISQHFSLIH